MQKPAKMGMVFFHRLFHFAGGIKFPKVVVFHDGIAGQHQLENDNQ